MEKILDLLATKDKHISSYGENLILSFINNYIHKNLYYIKYIKYKDKYFILIKDLQYQTN